MKLSLLLWLKREAKQANMLCAHVLAFLYSPDLFMGPKPRSWLIAPEALPTPSRCESALSSEPKLGSFCQTHKPKSGRIGRNGVERTAPNSQQGKCKGSAV